MFSGLFQMLSPMMLGMSAGSMVGHLARRCFGLYDLPIPRRPSDELALVVANVDAFADDWSLSGDDLRLWLCAQELTHHAVLGLPHVRDELSALIGAYVAGFRPNPLALEERLASVDPATASSLGSLQQVFGDPEVLLGAMRTPAQEALRPRLDALVAVIVGFVDHTMDTIGARLLGSHARLVEALRRHRVEADPSDRFVERLLGLSLGPDQVDRGSAFVAGVLERAGSDGLARLWTDAAHLPTPAEVDAPGLWLARIELR
jgi:putative hydrolase